MGTTRRIIFMGSHPINLLVRFLLEITALIAIGIWGWKLSDGWIRYILALGIPIVAAAIWGIFAVPDDPSRSGSAPIITPGSIRLVIELGFFGFASFVLYDMEELRMSLIFGVIVISHYLISYDRILWLLSH